jgi:ADP-dependent phosphofructokinase/glucokinase
VVEVDWFELYRGSVKNFQSRLPESGGIAVAYNTNIDGIIDLDGERIQRFLESQSRVANEAYSRKDSPPGRIDDPIDFVAGLMHFVERGSGGEYMVHDEDTYDWIVSNLPIDAHRMGGNAGIMANALSMLGARFVIPHAVQLPESQAKLFLNRDNVLLPVKEDGGVAFRSPSTASRPERELVHLILEYKEGTSFTWRGSTLTSPRNNRYIVNADDYNGRIAIDPSFVGGINQKIGEIDKFILTGLHMLKREYPDGVTYLDRLEEALGLVRGWRGKNPNMHVHFELADIQDEVIREDVLKMACEVSDSVGMNEDELETALGTEELLSSNPEKLVGGMGDFMSRCDIGKLLLHSKDFVVSLISDDYPIRPDVVRNSHMVGTLCSQYRAFCGDFGGPTELLELVNSGSLETSPDGLDMLGSFEEAFGDAQEPGTWENEEGGWIILTPTLLSVKTLNTVGLGDCLTAGTVLSELG